jgi:hypothetical protein
MTVIETVPEPSPKKRRGGPRGKPLHRVHGIELPRVVDRRRAESRLFRRRIEAYVAECGGESVLSEFDRGQIAALATIEVRIAAIRKAMLQGTDVESDELVRLTSESRRILSGLRAKMQKAKSARSNARRIPQREIRRRRCQ